MQEMKTKRTESRWKRALAGLTFVELYFKKA